MRKQIGAVLLLLAYGAIQPAWSAEVAKACDSAEHRQFDFWIGTWTVYEPSGKKAGENRIERISGGCALLENWTGSGGVTGKSLNIYDASDKHWHQFWVDSGGTRLVLRGRFADGMMILSTPNIPGVKSQERHRITWTRNADGSVRQLWESSTDAGVKWTVAFDGKYIKKQ